MHVSVEKCSCCAGRFSSLCGQVAQCHFLAAGLDSLISNLLGVCSGWRGHKPVECHHIVSYYFSVAVEEEHLFSVPCSHENSVSEPVDFFYTLLVILPAQISWLVPWGGNVNRYFRGADVWIIWLSRFILHCIANILLFERQSEFFVLNQNASYICK